MTTISVAAFPGTTKLVAVVADENQLLAVPHAPGEPVVPPPCHVYVVCP